jgi:signal transduction histidine kinase
MGLGLAIVRNIVEEANGKVWFTSVYGEGSSFFISFPEAH